MGIAMVNGKPVFKTALQSFEEQQLRDRINTQIDLEKLFKHIDDIYGLAGAGVVFVDSNFTIIELRKFEPVCQINPIKIVLREPPRMLNQAEFASHLRGSQGNVRESKLVSEIAGSVLSCGAAIIGWTVVLGSGAAIPLTGGTSSAITYLAIGASTASTMQCFNSGVRIYSERYDPSINDLLDSQEWYRNTSTALDLISLAGAGAASLATLKTVKLMQLGTGKNTLEILKGLSRSDKKRLNYEINRLNLPGASGRVLKSMARKGLMKKYTRIQITDAFRLKLRDGIGASMSFTGSAFSGTLKTIAIGIYEEISD
ncbi:hypothetical protein [Shewanella glacialimarina]|jgi:hypothetical protein|uniref:hypothetical protein n=1 Tax=Shewanella glacialimarina TaxID=2590884 RepID=UPI001CF8E615|nr:hypothetical protein [Shewanella glacialimarina]UCX06421.1 hypothetical protein FJ709_19090 [Shewanella glacialimarina]